MNNLFEHTKKYWYYYLPTGIWLIHLIIIFFYLPALPIKDERTFYEVSLKFRDFGSNGFFELLKTYNAPQTPLTFIFSGLLLKIDSSINCLRVFDSLLIFAAFVFFCKTIEGLDISSFNFRILFAGTLLINPYFHFTAVTFYTDAFYLFIISVILYFILKNKESIIIYAAFFLLLITRQFGIFIPAGYFFENINFKFPYINRKTLYSILSLSGLIFMIILWNGLMPDNSYKEMMNTVREKFGYIFAYVPAYNFSAIGFYLAPLFLLFIKKVIRNKMFYIGGISASIFYILFPAKQNFTNMLFQDYVSTLGFYHKTMLSIFGDPFFNVVLVCFSFLAGGWILILLISKTTPNLIKIWIILYIIMNFFNLQAWDKYLLDIELLLIFSIMLFLKDYLNNFKIKKPAQIKPA